MFSRLSYNSFSGAVSKEIGNLVNLKVLYEFAYVCGGSILLTIGRDLGGNKLAGQLPDVLGILPNLSSLYVLSYVRRRLY